MHKTGSTSIQNSFWKNLNSKDWKYARMGLPNHGPLFETILQEAPPCTQNYPYQNKSTDSDGFFGKMNRRNGVTAKLLRDIGQAGENYLLSGEWMSTDRAGYSKIVAFRELLSPYVENFAIVGYVRSPKSYMESSFQERLKRSSPALDFENLRPKYRKKLEKFDLVFGKENVMLWKFDPSTFTNHCVVQDFCRRLGIKFPKENIERKNESLSREAVAFLYAYRKYARKLNNSKSFSLKEDALLVNCLTQLKGSKLRFASEVVQPVLDANRIDIEWMENRLGESLAEPYENSTDAIRSEEDLLTYRPEDLLWLARHLGTEYVERCLEPISPKEVASWMLTLHLKLIDKNTSAVPSGKEATKVKRTSQNRVSLNNLVRLAKNNTPELAPLSDKQAVALLSSVFGQINQQAASMDKGALNIVGLGKFQIRQIGRVKSGQEILAKRVIFHPAKK
jgi:hypothetical protein